MSDLYNSICIELNEVISPRRILHPRARYKHSLRIGLSQTLIESSAFLSDQTARSFGLSLGKGASIVGFAFVYSHTKALPNAHLSTLCILEIVLAVIFAPVDLCQDVTTAGQLSSFV